MTLFNMYKNPINPELQLKYLYFPNYKMCYEMHLVCCVNEFVVSKLRYNVEILSFFIINYAKRVIYYVFKNWIHSELAPIFTSFKTSNQPAVIQ